MSKKKNSLYHQKTKKVQLCKSDLFGEEKRALLSSDTAQSHLDRKEIGAFDYTLIPNIIDGRAFKQKENTFVAIQKYTKFYRAALKNVKDKDEIFAISLVKTKDKEAYRLRRFEEVQE